MSQNVTKNGLTINQQKAALLVADDSLSDEDIAAKIGIARRTLARWKELPEFIARVVAIREKAKAAIEEKGILEKSNRLAAYNDRWKRMQQVIDERGADTEHATVPGFTTGLLVHQVKAVGRGGDFQLVDLYAVDTALLKELRDTEKQAAQELGEWVDRTTSFDLDSADLSWLTDDELDLIIAGADPRSVLAGARKRLAREKAATANA